ncbi:hypothetical protein LJK87_49050 [Paenibacillus sp. P25]|nr:hypothetical protein LJK87_49050 [Paenibacillus sp. P25]
MRGQLNQGGLNLTNYMNQLNELTFSIYRNASFTNLINSGFTGYESDAEIYNLMQTIALNPDVYQVYMSILKRGPGEPRSFLMFNMKKTPNMEVTEPPDRWLRKDSYESVVETTHLSHNYNIGPSFYFEPRYVLSIHRAIYRVPSRERARYAVGRHQDGHLGYDAQPADERTGEHQLAGRGRKGGLFQQLPG